VDRIRRASAGDNPPPGYRRATKVGVTIDFGRLFNRAPRA
jgi:hypothetical protein